MAYKKYSDAEVAEALVKLAINKYDFDSTSRDTGIAVRTLKRWTRLSPKKGVYELLERAITRMLMVIPEKWDGNSWAIALGILMDKWLLVQGKATSRIETLFGELEQIGDDELDQLITEFERAARVKNTQAGEGAPQSEEEPK